MKMSVICAKYDHLSHREKVLIVLTSAIVVLALFFLLLIEPQFNAMQKAKQSLQQTKHLADKLETQSSAMQITLSSDAVTSINQKISLLQQEISELEDSLLEQKIAVLSAQDLTRYLHKVLSSASKFKIERFSVDSQPFTQDEDLDDTQSIFLIKQNISLSLQGSEKALTDYLKSLEALAVSVSWDSLEYQHLKADEVALIARFHLFSAKD